MKNNALCPIVFKSFIAVSTTLWYCINVILAALYKESCLHSPFKILFRSLALTDFLRLDLFFRTDSMIVEYKKNNLWYHMFVQLKKSKQANKQIMKHPLNLMHSSYIYEGFQASLPGENNDYFYVSCDSHWVQYTNTPFISWHGRTKMANPIIQSLLKSHYTDCTVSTSRN